jgi:hypothetical protein
MKTWTPNDAEFEAMFLEVKAEIAREIAECEPGEELSVAHDVLWMLEDPRLAGRSFK